MSGIWHSFIRHLKRNGLCLNPAILVHLLLILLLMIDRNLRIVFMGTPEFAVPSLQILLDAGYPVVGVVTAPDKASGRGMRQLMVSAVKSFALDHSLKVLQPQNLKSKDFIHQLRELKADLHVVVAFRMLPEVVWSMPPNGTMNLHASLLPAYRGAAPIQWALINGEKKTGLTTFFLRHEIDSGHIIKQMEMPILAEDDAGTLHDRMMHAGAGLVLGSVDLIKLGKAHPEVQDESKSSHAPKIHHKDARLDWNLPAPTGHNLIRGMAPYPGAWSILDGLECKILKSGIYSQLQVNPIGQLSWENKKLIVQAKDGEIEILKVQFAGKKRMPAREFMNGYKIKDWSMT